MPKKQGAYVCLKCKNEHLFRRDEFIEFVVKSVKQGFKQDRLNKKELKIPDNIRILGSPDELMDFLNDLKDGIKPKQVIKNVVIKNNPTNMGF